MTDFIKTVLFQGIMTLCGVVLSLSAAAQQGTVKGKVSDENGPVPFVSVSIARLNKGTITNEKGEFTLSNLPEGPHEVMVSGVGYEPQTVTAIVPGKALSITIKISQTQLQEVTVEGRSETQLVKESPIKSAVIDTKVASRMPSTMVELMNRSAGLRVRQTGGLGSEAGLVVNGFQDRAIKYFKDGIPMDYLGAGYNFSLVPVNQLERLEVYKGVLPVALGADALGGGINMITRQHTRRSIDASYEIGSFNTHRATLNLYYPDTAHHFFAGLETFVNYSDNNYEVTPDLLKKKVRLFHNQFRHYYGEVYGGVKNTRWADELRVGVAGFWMARDNQYGARMSGPFGAYTSEQYTIVPTLRYKKYLFNDRLFIDQFIEANNLNVTQVDTAGGTYDWYGNFSPNPGRIGESSVQGSLADTDFKYITSRTYVSFEITPTQQVTFNFAYIGNEREGSDPLGTTFVGSGRDILSVPASYDKIVSAIGLESRFRDDRLVNNFIVKYYHFTIDALDADWKGAEAPRSTTNARWGAADAIKYSLTERSFIRASAEVATRLPEQDEIFGDGNLHVANFELKPEKSINGNIGYFRKSPNDKLSLELNAFYRNTRDRIINVPFNLIFNRNENVENVRGIGFETDVTYALRPWLFVNGNFTYQDYRLFDTGVRLTEDSRLKNVPYFFSNLGLSAGRESILNKRDKFEAYWFFSFVREYYLASIPKDFEPEGFLGLWGRAKIDAQNIIPDQAVHTAGFTYFPLDNKFSAAFQVKNIFDSKVYDNFRIQNAGRSFHLKLTYTIQ